MMFIVRVFIVSICCLSRVMVKVNIFMLELMFIKCRFGFCCSKDSIRFICFFFYFLYLMIFLLIYIFFFGLYI